LCDQRLNGTEFPFCETHTYTNINVLFSRKGAIHSDFLSLGGLILARQPRDRRQYGTWCPGGVTKKFLGRRIAEIAMFPNISLYVGSSPEGSSLKLFLGLPQARRPAAWQMI
jgi:hypothetical protein